MRPPKCKLFLPVTRYPRKVWRSLHFDGDKLVVDIQGEGFAYGRIIFQSPVWFRVLDERDLCEFWNTYSEPNGWLWEVEEGGWLELESQRQHFNSRDFIPGLREFLIVDDQCISILTVESPEIHDFGAEPEHAKPNA